MPMITQLLPKAAKTSIKRFIFKYSTTASQVGQDYWVCGEVFNEKKSGYFLDIGAHNGVDISNTYILESKYNWSGLCIEANPTTFPELKKNRRVKCLNVCLDDKEREVNFALNDVMGGIIDQGLDNKKLIAEGQKVIKLKTASLINVLEKHQAPSVIDYLSIDIEGAEERVLGNFNFGKYTFKCLTIERPSEHLRDILKGHAYLLIKEIPKFDCFYVHESFLQEYRNNLFKFYRKKHLTMRWM